MITKIAGRVRGLFNMGAYPENREDEQFHINPRGEQIVAQGLPELTEVVRLGQSWQVKVTAGVTALAALPTTVNHLGIYNGEPSIGKVYVIDSVATWETIQDVTTSQQTTLFAMLNKGTLVTIPTVTALTPASLSGRANYDGRASFSAGATGLVNDGWYPVGTSAPSGTTAVAGAMWKVTDIPLRGQYIVTPGTAFHLAATKAGGGSAGQFYCIRWHEVQLPWRP